MAKPKQDDESHLIEDPSEQARFQNATLAKIRIHRAEIAQMREAMKKVQQEEAACWRDIKSKCGIDRDVAEQGLAAIDLPEEKRLAKLAMWNRFFANAGVGEQLSLTPGMTTARAPDQALDAAKVQAAQAAGFDAGMKGRAATDNPYAGGSAEGVAWAAAFGRAQEQLGREMAAQPVAPAVVDHEAWAGGQFGGGQNDPTH